jgi:hypothetical protein
MQLMPFRPEFSIDKDSVMFFKRIIGLLYPLYAKYFCRARIIEGSLKGNQRMARCLVLGESPFISQLEERMFEAPPHVIRTWRMRISAFHNNIKNEKDKIDFCISEFPKRYYRKFKTDCDFMCQRSVGQSLDASAHSPSFTVFNKRMKETEKIIKKYKLSYRVSESDDDFEMFYHNMYIPYAKKRFGKNAVMFSFKKMKNVFKKSVLMFVIQDDIAIAGDILSLNNEILGFQHLGILNGEREYVKMGFATIFYYFGIDYVNKTFHYSKLDFGSSLPFLDDGAFLYKRKMGAAVHPDDTLHSWIFILDLKQSDSFTSVFESHPIIVHTDAGLMALVGVPEAHELTIKQRDIFIKKYYSPGLKGIILYNSKRDASKLLLFDTPDYLQKWPPRPAHSDMLFS